MKTDLNLVNRAELAAHLNISLSYVDKLRTTGVFRYVKGKRFDLAESVRALRALRKKDAGYLESVLRRTLSRAELAKQRLSNLQHKCTNLDWERVLTYRISNSKGKLLGIPQSANTVIGCTAEKIEELLKNKIDEAIAEFKPFNLEDCKSADVDYAPEYLEDSAGPEDERDVSEANASEESLT